MGTLDKEAFGTLLKASRLKKGISLKEISAHTKIKVVYLTALEEGHFDALPTHAYLHGFLRIYAAYLNLDAGELLEQFSAQDPPFIETTLAHSPTPELQRRQTGFRRPVFWGFASMGLVLLGTLLFLFSPGNSDRKSAPGVLPPTVSLNSIALDKSFSYPEGSLSEKNSEEPVGDDRGICETQTASEPSAGGESQDVACLQPEFRVLKVVATGNVRIDFSADGKPVQTYFLKEGTILRWSFKDAGKLKVDDAGAVRLWLDSAEKELKTHTWIVFNHDD